MFSMNSLSIPILVAGFIGSTLSLSLSRNITPLWAFMTVIAGTVSAMSLTPLAMKYADFGRGSQDALAFIIGVMGMNALVGVYKFSERFANAPNEILEPHQHEADK